MKNKNCLVLIPARYDSSRFPGKPLAKINDKSMIRMVYENCLGNNDSGPIDFEVVVVTDDERIEQHVKSFGGKVVMVYDEVTTGSERIYLAWQRFFKNKDYDFIINVQGDEPLLERSELERMVDFHAASGFDIVTMVSEQKGDNERFHDPNNVKAIYQRENGRCHFFSRAAIPFSRDEKIDIWYLHVGIYSYRLEALRKFNECGHSYYEMLEKLEQLRALENHLTIGAIQARCNLVGVDTPEDIATIEGVLSDKKIN
ncbi:MAG: 3-deoxy-manno-octulosonate cytidylyltransferase [Bacteriovoracaceae bacterium]|nr:3-deoxy-manno-octulosonate cytidylyltransferase [Bacteriovoracaceae bacterium]